MGATWRPRSLAASTATCWLEIIRTCVLVPIQTENRLRFSAQLTDEEVIKVEVTVAKRANAQECLILPPSWSSDPRTRGLTA
jgi:hypothetical protein